MIAKFEYVPFDFNNDHIRKHKANLYVSWIQNWCTEPVQHCNTIRKTNWCAYLCGTARLLISCKWDLVVCKNNSWNLLRKFSNNLKYKVHSTLLSVQFSRVEPYPNFAHQVTDSHSWPLLPIMNFFLASKNCITAFTAENMAWHDAITAT